MNEEKVFFKNAQGLNICGILEEPSRKREEIVIIVHGYSSHKNRTSAKGMAEELRKRNINSLRIDLAGCGESEGTFENQTITSAAEDVSAAIVFIKARGYAKIDLFGSSAGGLAVMTTALRHPEINRIALKAPVSDYHSHQLKTYGQKYIDRWKKQGFHYYVSSDGTKHKVNYSFFEDIQNYVMYDKVKDITCPVLIIHGTADTDVDIEQSKKVVKGFPNAELIILEGADHGLAINGDREKANTLFGDWFEKGIVSA